MTPKTPWTIHLPTPHRNQRTVLKSSARFRVVACGRRFGKTFVGLYAILAAAARGQKCWWLAPTYAMADHVWAELKTACRDLPGLNVHEQTRRLDFRQGGSIAIHSAHLPDHLRGAGLDFVVLDEAAFMESSVWPQVVRPMLLDRSGGALFLSSPAGRNTFWEVYHNGLQRRTGWRSFHFTSFDTPLIDPAELETIRQQTPERIWRAEYLAECVEDSGRVFRASQAAATAPLDAEPVPGVRYVAGIDWGRENDLTAIVVLDADHHRLVAIDAFTGIGWDLQRGRLQAVYDRWRPVVVWAESNSIGSPNIEALQAEGLPMRPFAMTATSKPTLIDALALAIERRQLALQPDESLLSELAAYTVERQPAGNWRYSAPSGLHDDRVIALALAWHGLRHSALPISFV
ncbi:MAG: terminase family protein [Anaerolineae bacterium]|nr:terminase family protein [Anaerolineae bacterium]